MTTPTNETTATTLPVPVTEPSEALVPPSAVTTPTPVIPGPTARVDSPTAATAPAVAVSETVPLGQTSTAPPASPAGDDPDLLRLIQQWLETQRKQEAAPLPAKPELGEHNVILEGRLEVRSDDGILVSIPINAMLPGALSPACIQGFQVQFESILNQLVLQPANQAFVSVLDGIQAERKDLCSTLNNPGTNNRTNGCDD